jgi:arylsulfatase A-like enzyme
MARVFKASGFLLAVLLAASAAGSAPQRPPSAPAAGDALRRSLLLVTFDTTRADHVGCYGYRLPTTPTVDRLAAEGVRFDHAFAPAVNTVPSHATIFTGLYPSGHGSRFNAVPLNPEFPTLTSILAEAKYATAAFVSGNTLVASQSGLERGFSVYDDGFTGQDRPAAVTVDRAVAWLKQRPADRPYFLFVHLFDPHGRYEPPAEYAKRFRTGKYEPIPAPDAIPAYQRQEAEGGSVSLDPLDYVSRYDGEIAYADAQLARLLEAAGRDPLVVFTADHGETLVERDYHFQHGARLNDEAIRIPLIIRFPEPKLRGRRVSGTAQLIDLFPTVLRYLGFPVPRRLPGRDLMRFIRAGAIPPGGVVISEARADPIEIGDRSLTFPPRSVILSARNERYKLIRYPSLPAPTHELFDLGKDPGEKTNLYPARPPASGPLFEALDLYQTMGKPPEPPDLDEATREKLRSLGYIN